MQIMIFLDSTLCLLSIQLYHPLLILAHILRTLDQFTPRHRIPVGVFQMGLLSIITGMGHQFLERCLRLLHSLLWMSIITVGSTIPLPFLHQAVVLVVLIRLQFHLGLTGLLGQILISKDQDLLCIHSLWDTGKLLRSRSAISSVVNGR